MDKGTTKGTAMRTTKLHGKKTIYRQCDCGETAHDGAADKNSNGEWFHFYACRNCGSRIHEAKTAGLVD